MRNHNNDNDDWNKAKKAANISQNKSNNEMVIKLRTTLEDWKREWRNLIVINFTWCLLTEINWIKFYSALVGSPSCILCGLKNIK